MVADRRPTSGPDVRSYCTRNHTLSSVTGRGKDCHPMVRDSCSAQECRSLGGRCIVLSPITDPKSSTGHTGRHCSSTAVVARHFAQYSSAERRASSDVVRCPTGLRQPFGRFIAWICQFQLSRSASTSLTIFAAANWPLTPTQSSPSCSHRIIVAPESGGHRENKPTRDLLTARIRYIGPIGSRHEGTERVVSRDLVVFGRDVVERLAQECAAGRRTVHLQLLASPFYEALKREIGRTPACEAEKTRALAAAADQCRRAASCALAPANVVVELRAALATLSRERPPSLEAQVRVRPQLRLIQGGPA
jgi:hypothetical protein